MVPKPRKEVVAAPIPPRPTAVGTANSPPDRKVAGLPLIVTRVGSARIFP
jgi:hypothetical protein